MRAGFVPLYRLAQPLPLLLAGVALALVAVALIVVHLVGGASAAPEPLFTSPFRWLPTGSSA
jgi:hypothetical protein